jgi:preprotein translocase subunit SecA
VRGVDARAWYAASIRKRSKRHRAKRKEISEMRTGEGETLVATLATYPRHRRQKASTSSPRLLGPPWMLNGCSQLYTWLGLTAGDVLNMDETTKRDAYTLLLPYGTNNEFGFPIIYARTRKVAKA